jgi:hypothetical protein
MSEECVGLAGRLFGHCIEDVVEKEEGPPAFVPDQPTVERKVPSELEVIRDMIAVSTPSKERYVHSICRRCGMVVSRKSPIG